MQETFLRAYRSWDSYRPGTECRGWLFTICRNEFLRRATRAQREIPLDAPELEARAAANVHDSVRDTVFEDVWVRVGTVRSSLFRGRRILQEALLVHARDAGFGTSGGRTTGDVQA